MSEERRSRLAPIPPAVLQGLSPSAGSESCPAEGVDSLRPLHEAQGRRELSALLPPSSVDPQATLRNVDAELGRLFAGHESSLSALRLELSHVRLGLEEAPGTAQVALDRFEELLEALVDRHGLWGERS